MSEPWGVVVPPARAPAELPSGLPAELPSGLPAELPSGLPAELPSALSAELPSELPSALAGGLASAADPPWRRLSVGMLLVHPMQEVLRGLPALVPLLVAGASAGSAWPGLIGLVVAVALGTSRWFTTRFRVTSAQVQLRHGLFTRRTVAVPLDRVRTVDVEANLLHRGLGLVRLRVGTGQAETKRSKNLALDGLSTIEGVRLRDELLHIRGSLAPTRVAAGLDQPPAAPADAEFGPTSSGSYVARRTAGGGVLVRLAPAWIRYGPFSLTGVITAAAALGLGWRVAGEAHVDPTHLGIVRSGRDAAQGRSTWLVVVVVVVAALIVVTALSTLRYVLAYWGFVLTRTSAGTLHINRGLLTTHATTLEERRVRGVALTEPLPLRSVGGAQVTAVATGLRTGRGADAAGGALLLPPAPRSVALAVSRAVLAAGAEAVDAPVVRHGPAARRRRFTRAGWPGVVLLGAALISLAGGAPGWILLIPIATLAAAGPLALDRYRNLGHATAARRLITSEGSLIRRRVVLADDAVIGWNLRATVFQRRTGLVTLTATTACGARRYRVLDVAEAEAERLADEITPGVLAPFLV